MATEGERPGPWLRWLPEARKALVSVLGAEPPFRGTALLSLALLTLGLILTWDWFDVDEFVNLQQAVRVSEGRPLYLETESHHPPFFTIPWLILLLHLPAPDLVAARLGSLLLAWLSGVLLADLWRRHGRPQEARTFLLLWSLSGIVLLAGTRAMNEVPLLFFLALALWLLVRFDAWALAGAAAALAVLTRFTALFFLPALFLARPHRWRRLLLAGTATFVAALALYAWAQPGLLAHLWTQAAGYHLMRPPSPFYVRVLSLVFGSGLLLLAFLAWRHGRSLPHQEPLARVAIASCVGAVALILLPAVHVHYFLPFAPVVTAAATHVLHSLPRTLRPQRALIVALALLVPGTQAAIYVANTPHPSLDETETVAAWVRTHTPPTLPILSDAPEYAYLAPRDNWEGYFWSLRISATPEILANAWNATSVVIASERFGRYDTGFPPAFLDALDERPCLTVETAHVYWTGTAGPAPEGFGDARTTCPIAAPSALRE